MKWIERMGKFFGLVPDFTADDVLNAEQEDVLREHGKMLSAVQVKAAERKIGNSKLRAALDEAKSSMSITALADFETSIQHERTQAGVRRSNH